MGKELTMAEAAASTKWFALPSAGKTAPSPGGEGRAFAAPKWLRPRRRGEGGRRFSAESFLAGCRLKQRWLLILLLPLLAASFHASGGNTNGVPSVCPAPRNGVCPPAPPGVYQAKPYSLIVVVPPPVEQRMVHRPRPILRYAMPSVQRPFRLEPKK
jgi:hypothetical protein